MWILGAEVPNGLIFAVLPTVLVLLVALVAWIVKEQGKSSVTQAVHDTKISGLEDEIKDLKGEMRDGRRQ